MGEIYRISGREIELPEVNEVWLYLSYELIAV